MNPQDLNNSYFSEQEREAKAKFKKACKEALVVTLGASECLLIDGHVIMVDNPTRVRWLCEVIRGEG